MNNSNAVNILTTISPAKRNNTNLELRIFSRNDKNVQCTLLDSPLYLELRSFSIKDKYKRKILMRSIFGWIILQNLIYVPIMYMLLQNEDLFFDVSDNYDDYKVFLEILLAVNCFMSAVFYYFRSFRRPVTRSYLSLMIATIISAVLIGIFATTLNSLLILMQPIILILQLLAIILFSTQSKLELTLFRAFLIITAIWAAFTLLDIFIIKTYSVKLYIAYFLGTLTTAFITFDTQLMLTSPVHKYYMAANEHVFGAVNIYADQSKLAWLLFRTFFLDSTLLICKTIFRTIRSKLY